MTTHALKKTLKRLEKDLQELTTTPLPNISAAPLESNMLEWHCNILYNDNILHLILFFPKNYPCTSPRLEVLPQGFNMNGVVGEKGEKGTKICLDIFSDFAEHHPEWTIDKESGWSPSYTVQSLLLNLLSYLHDQHLDEDHALSSYIESSKMFVCADCGHSLEQTYPPLDEYTKDKCLQCDKDDCLAFDKDDCLKSTDDDCLQSAKDAAVDHQSDFKLKILTDNRIEPLETRIMDYVSREKYSITNASSKDHIFGFGLILSDYKRDCFPTSPCEFVTANSFHEMCNTLGKGKSILRDDLSYFLPLYITNSHASNIKPQFESTMARISRKYRFKFSIRNNHIHVIINVFSHLLTSIVEQCCTFGRTPSDKILDGYFQLHRLFLWAVESYPKVLKYVNKRLELFISNPKLRNKRSDFDFTYCFALLSVSTTHTWESVAEIYLKEHWRRSVKTCHLQDFDFGVKDMPIDEGLNKTFNLTTHVCRQLAYHVIFLKKAKPIEMSKEDILQRYEDNHSFVPQDIVLKLRDSIRNIKDHLNSFDDWFRIIGLSVPSKEYLYNDLKESFKYAIATRGYHKI